jgi:hypothetical protein
LKASKRFDAWLLQYLRVLRLGICFARHAHEVTVDVAPRAAEALDDGILVFTAADSVYLRRFFRPFAGSLVAHVPSPRLHVHLYDPGTDDFDLVKSVQRQFPDLQLTWSHATFAAADLDRRAKASPRQSWKSLYICCSRFLAAQEIQKATGASLLISDIDVLFNGNLEDRFTRDIACALLLRPEEDDLSKRALGGVVFVSASAVGQRFLARACGRIARFLAAGFYWFAFDQYALWRAVQTMPAHEKRSCFSPLTEADVSFDLSEEALILYPKGALKDDDEYSSLAGSYEQSQRGGS